MCYEVISYTSVVSRPLKFGLRTRSRLIIMCTHTHMRTHTHTHTYEHSSPSSMILLSFMIIFSYELHTHTCAHTHEHSSPWSMNLLSFHTQLWGGQHITSIVWSLQPWGLHILNFEQVIDKASEEWRNQCNSITVIDMIINYWMCIDFIIWKSSQYVVYEWILVVNYVHA